MAETKRQHHVNGRRTGNHSVRKRRRAYPSPESPNFREGVKYGIRGAMQGKPADEKGKR